MVDFDDARLEDPARWQPADPVLRHLAGAGARVRVEAEAAHAPTAALDQPSRPRAVLAVGSEARLVRSLLEPVCPVPLMAWSGPSLPGWVGPLDLVVVLAAHGGEKALVQLSHEAVRRGAQLLVAAPQDAPVAQAAASRATTLLTTTTADALAAVVVTATALHALELGPAIDAEQLARALDRVAEECSPWVDLSTNPAKDLAIALAEAQPLVWGGSVLSARASRRVAEALRAASGRPALAADAEALLPVLTATQSRDLFADPYHEPAQDRRPGLVVLDDGLTDELAQVSRRQLEAAAERADVRCCQLEHDEGPGLLRYAALLQRGRWAAAYLAVGLDRMAALEER